MRVPEPAMDEASRNRALRRADWRFLAGRTRFRRAACAAGPELREAVAALSESVGELDRTARDFDLVALSNPREETLRAAYEALQPGGACYAEWTRPLPGGAGRVRARLERAGFADVGCWWPWPPPARTAPAFWLPLDAPGAVRHFLVSRPRPRSARGRLGAAALRLLWRVAYRARLLAPVCAVARRPPGPATDAAPLLLALREGWPAWGLGPTPRELACVLHTGGLRSINKVVALVHADDEEHPRIAVKLARVPESEPALVREAEALTAVHERSSAPAGVPRLVFRDDRLPGIGETVVEGQPLSTTLDARSHRKLALGVTDLLAGLAGEARPARREEWWERLVETAVARFEACFGEVVEPAQIDAARAVLATLPDLPLTCEQRDCSPWNVLVSRSGALAMVDWESAEPRGLPALDLVYFLAHATFFVERTMGTSRAPASYARMLDPSTPPGLVYSECVARYADRTGIDPAAVGPLRMLTWMVHARSDFEHLVLGRGERPDASALRGSLFLALWREELRRAAPSVAEPGPAPET